MSPPRLLTKRISKKGRECFLCERPATTVDHLPPECFFPLPLPDNMITVPCCSSCNGKASKDDQRARFLFAMDAYQKTPEQAAEYWQQVLATLKTKRPKTLELINRNISNLLIYDPEFKAYGNYVSLPTEHYYSVFRRIVKGLYYLDKDKKLPDDVRVIVERGYFTGEPPTAFRREHMQVYAEVGPMRALWMYAADDDRLSFWRFEFFGAHHVIAYTMPPGFPDVLSGIVR